MYLSALYSGYTAGCHPAAHWPPARISCSRARNQVAAGYMVYGFVYHAGICHAPGASTGLPSTPSIGEFLHEPIPNIKCPEYGKIYSVNHGNFFQYAPRRCRPIYSCARRKQKPMAGPTPQRYIREHGGRCAPQPDQGRYFYVSRHYRQAQRQAAPDVRMQPPLPLSPKWREARPTNGRERILDVQPTELHQRSALFIGSKGMMQELEACLDA